MFKRADVVSVHLVLSGRTRGLVGAPELALMKATARLVNTSRGPIVVEADLIAALDSRPGNLVRLDPVLPSFGLVLDAGTVALLVDICGDSSLFEDAHQLRRRIVRWGSTVPSMVSQPAVSIQSSKLRQRLLNIVSQQLGRSCFVEELPAQPASIEAVGEVWTLSTTPSADRPGSVFRRIGNRVTLSTEVALARHADPSTCLIDAQPPGWIYLAPLSDGHALLQATVPSSPSCPTDTLAKLVDRSRLISPLVTSEIAAVQVLPTAPAFRQPCGGGNWFAAGAAAMVLDPLCGEGTGHSLRTGLLAAGVIATVAETGNREPLVRHFDDRLRMAFASHLAACSRFYNRDVFNASWDAEIDVILRSAVDFPAPNSETLRFRFADLHLLPIEETQ